MSDHRIIKKSEKYEFFKIVQKLGNFFFEKN
jgi:hypothetical protein